MILYLRRFLIRYAFSPYGIAVVPYCIFLFAWNFPPNLYTYYVDERDVLYRNLLALLFFTACTVAFLVGVRVVGLFDSAASATSVPRVELRGGSPLLYLIVPLILAGLFCLGYLSVIGASLNVFALILSQQGSVIKQNYVGGEGSAYWGSALFVLTGVLWWAGFRARQLEMQAATRRLFSTIYTACFLIDLVTCLATFDRTNLMPLLAGSTIIYLFFKTRGENVKLGRLFFIAAGSVAIILSAFIGLQFARGTSHVDNLIASMLGYTIVSFNRMAALVMGIMHYVYQGKGAYVVPFLLENGRFAGLRDQMGLPTSYGLWVSEFPSLIQSGLNSSYNWASVFGYLYSDLGWWTPAYMFVFGIFAGYLWARFRGGSSFGIVFYPWMVFWILFWFGWNLLLDARGVVLLELSVLLSAYDWLYLRRRREARQTGVVRNSPWETPRPALPSSRGGLL